MRILAGWPMRRRHDPEREGITGEWTEMHNGELHNLYSSPDAIRIIKIGRLRWIEHVASIVEM
jgi:hypothetical protein